MRQVLVADRYRKYMAVSMNRGSVFVDVLIVKALLFRACILEAPKNYERRSSTTMRLWPDSCGFAAIEVSPMQLG